MSGKIATTLAKIALSGDVRPRTPEWKRRIGDLVSQADQAVEGSAKFRSMIEQTHRRTKKRSEKQMAALSAAASRQSGATHHEVQKLRSALEVIENEMKLLLSMRQKVIARNESLTKPIDTIRRRIVYRVQNTPEQDLINDAVERDLNNAALSLEQVHGELSGAAQAAETLVAFMEKLRLVLAQEVQVKQTVQQTEASSGDAQPSPRRLTAFTIRGRVDSTAACQSALSESAALRARMGSALKSSIQLVSRSTEAVDRSLQAKVADAKSLVGTLTDKIARVEAELAAADEEKARLEKRIVEARQPLDTLTAKIHTRQRNFSQTKLQTVVDSSAADTAASLKHAILSSTQDLARLEDHRRRLLRLLESLKAEKTSKVSLIATEERLMTIGLTPAPPRTPRSTRGSS